jgi:hypothetical protein
MPQVGDKVVVRVPEQSFFIEGQVAAVATNDLNEIIYKVPTPGSTPGYDWFDAKRVFAID